MRPPIVVLAAALSMPLPALADLILVEDNRFVETNVDGAVTRVERSGSLSWEWSAEMPQYPVMSQVTTFDGNTTTDEYQNWSFTLEVPEPTAVAILPLVLAVAAARHQCAGAG